MNFHRLFCLCHFDELQDWFRKKFYDKEKKRWKHKWIIYVGIGLYLLHWLWHIAVGAAVISFFYNLFN